MIFSYSVKMNYNYINIIKFVSTNEFLKFDAGLVEDIVCLLIHIILHIAKNKIFLDTVLAGRK